MNGERRARKGKKGGAGGGGELRGNRHPEKKDLTKKGRKAIYSFVRGRYSIRKVPSKKSRRRLFEDRGERKFTWRRFTEWQDRDSRGEGRKQGR